MIIQKFKKYIFNVVILGQLATPLSAMANTNDANIDKVKNKILAKSGDLFIDTVNKYGDILNIKWAKGDFRAISSGGVGLNFKALSVIKEYKKQVFFTQYGVSKEADATTLNLGLGFNHLMPKAILPLDIVIGGNAFYDARTGTDSILNPFGEGVHKRFSVGGTIMTSQAGVFFNIYKGLSESIGGYKASDGYDFGVNGLVPTLESVNLGVTMYEFNEENKGSKFKIEYKPNSFFTFGAEQDQSDSPSTSVYIETKYKFYTPFEDQLKSITNVTNNVWDKRYDEVERENTLILEVAQKDSITTLGHTYYNAQKDTDRDGDTDDNVFYTMKLTELDNFNTNGQDLTFSGDDVNVQANGTPWADNAIDKDFLTNLTKDCAVDENTVIYIKKDAQCDVNVTFVANDNYKEKTEKITIYGRDTTASSASLVKAEYKVTGVAIRSIGNPTDDWTYMSLDNLGVLNPNQQDYEITALDGKNIDAPLLKDFEVKQMFKDYSTTKNCYLTSSNIYVKRGTSCLADVTFKAKDSYRNKPREKTLTIKFYAEYEDKEKQRSGANAGSLKLDYIQGQVSMIVKVLESGSTGIYQLVQLSPHDTGNKKFRLMSLENVYGYENPHSQDLAYYGTDVSVRADGTPWAKSDLTDGFLNSSDKNCFALDDDTIYIRENTSCHFSLEFKEDANTYSVYYKGLGISADRRESQSQTGIGTKPYKVPHFAPNGLNEWMRVILNDMPSTDKQYGYKNGVVQDITFSGDDVDTKENGVPWTYYEATSNPYNILWTTDKNCAAVLIDKQYSLYVKKGTNCTIDATFMENDTHRAKTETVTLYADE